MAKGNGQDPFEGIHRPIVPILHKRKLIGHEGFFVSIPEESKLLVDVDEEKLPEITETGKEANDSYDG